MILKSKKLIILSQVFILLAFMGGMWLNYYFLSPFIFRGEDAQQVYKLDAFRSHFTLEGGCDFRDRDQVDSVLALGLEPFPGDMFLLDEEGRMYYPEALEDGFEYIHSRYGDIALKLLKSEYESKSPEAELAYSSPTHTGFFAHFSRRSGLMFFYASDYYSAAKGLMTKFLYLLIFMAVVGLVLLVIGLLIVNLSTRQFEKESQTQLELDTASQIQKSMLPSGHKHMMQIDVNAKLVPAKKVAGDFYCYLLREGLLYFCIGDVSGKGVPSSLFMSKAVTLFRSYASSLMPPAAIASSMNRELCVNNEQNMFLTGIIGTMRATDGVVRYVSAGHEPPVVWDGNPESKLDFLKTAGNVPLGVVSDVEFREESYEIQKNGLFFLYTDGFSEAKSPRSGYICRDKVLDVLEPYKDLSSAGINDAVLHFVAEFEAGAEQSDDITLLTFRNTAKPKKMTIRNEISELRRLSAFTEEVFKECPMDSRERILVRSGLDEALTNCVLYAYDGPGHEIEVIASIEHHCLCFTLRDSGVPFNPLEYKPAPSDEVKIGGLGISMYKANYDRVEYRREDGFNVLKLIKSL